VGWSPPAWGGGGTDAPPRADPGSAPGFPSAETAVNIGYSCKMLTDDMTEVFVVTGHTVLEVREELR